MRDWTSENESHDPQCRERHGTRCSQCGERYHEDEITYIDGKTICCDCLKEYIEEYGKEHAEDFIEDFISANLDARAEDFWKNDLDEQTKKRLMRNIYQEEKRMRRMSNLHNIEQADRDFCLSSDDYSEFVRERLCW